MLSRRVFLQDTMKAGLLLITPKGVIKFFPIAGEGLPPVKDIVLRFAVCSDGHYGQPDTGYDAYHDSMIRWLNAEKDGRGLHFTTINGDLFHNDPEFLPVVKKKWDNLNMPYYVSHGNHDMVTPDVWQTVWGMPTSHKFEYGDCGFIIVDTADDKGNYICPPDMDWVKDSLQKLRVKKHVFVFMHIPGIKEWSPFAIDCPEIMALFAAQKNLRAVYHGHDHTIDGRFEYKSKNFFFDAHLGGNWGTPYKGYRITEVLKNGNILTYQVDAATGKTINRNNIDNQL